MTTVSAPIILKTLKRSLLRTFWEINHPDTKAMSIMAMVHGHTPSDHIVPWIERPEIREAMELVGLPKNLPVPSYESTEYGLYDFQTRPVFLSEEETIDEVVWDIDSVEPWFRGTIHEVVNKKQEDPERGSLARTGNTIDGGEERAFFAKYLPEDDLSFLD